MTILSQKSKLARALSAQTMCAESFLSVFRYLTLFKVACATLLMSYNYYLSKTRQRFISIAWKAESIIIYYEWSFHNHSNRYPAPKEQEQEVENYEGFFDHTGYVMKDLVLLLQIIRSFNYVFLV